LDVSGRDQPKEVASAVRRGALTPGGQIGYTEHTGAVINRCFVRMPYTRAVGLVTWTVDRTGCHQLAGALVAFWCQPPVAD
jgi:hypothetical protein